MTFKNYFECLKNKLKVETIIQTNIHSNAYNLNNILKQLFKKNVV